MTRWVFMKTITPMLIFSIFLPLVDIVTDMRMIITFYIIGHPNYATMLLMPFCLNYIISFVKWYEWEPSKLRKKTFIYPLLNVFEIFGLYANDYQLFWFLIPNV